MTGNEGPKTERLAMMRPSSRQFFARGAGRRAMSRRREARLPRRPCPSSSAWAPPERRAAGMLQFASAVRVKGTDDRFSDHRRFRVSKVLGQGAHGIVYDAEDSERGQRVALKKLKNLDPAAVYRFKQEFRAVAALRHANLVRVHELMYSDGDWYLTMDVIEGEDFIAHVRGEAGLAVSSTVVAEEEAAAVAKPRPARAPTGRLDERRLRSALGQLAAGVLAIHAAGRLHRDLKPSNIRVTAEGRVFILDFGLAVAWQSDDGSGRTLERTGDLLGTPLYMSPEQAAGQRLTQASDWYSVGVILYEALTGRVPFEGGAYDVLRGKQIWTAPDPRAHAPDLPGDLAE